MNPQTIYLKDQYFLKGQKKKPLLAGVKDGNFSKKKWCALNYDTKKILMMDCPFNNNNNSMYLQIALQGRLFLTPNFGVLSWPLSWIRPF